MISWDSNPWSNFCDPDWELICHKKLYPDLLTIKQYSAARKRSQNYSHIFKVTGQVRESQKKRININTNHNYYQRSSPWPRLNWSNYKIRLSFNQLNRKRWSARLVCVVKHLPHKVFSLWYQNLSAMKNALLTFPSSFKFIFAHAGIFQVSISVFELLCSTILCSMLLYIISSVFIILNLNIFWELNDHVLLLIILLQMLIATRRESRGGSESNDQMSLRNLQK